MVDDELARLLRAAREAWPDIQRGDEDFTRRVTELLRDQAELRHATDLYLACACAAGDPVALRSFEEKILPESDAAVRKIDRSNAFVDEVRQLLRKRLLVAEAPERPRIASYQGRGPLTTWVRVAAVRAALNLRGKHHREVPATEDQIAAAAPIDQDPALAYLKRRYAAEFEDAFRQACNGLGDRERNLLRLNFGDGLNIEQIGAVYGVHRATVARWIARAREQLFEGTRAELEAKLELSRSEFDSLVRLVRSQIDISISKFFSATKS